MATIASIYSALISKRIYRLIVNEEIGDALCASKFNARKATNDSNLTIFNFLNSKPALTEGLEIDQYMWAILNTLTTQQDTEEVMVDAQANWKAIKPMSINGIKQEPTDPDCKQFSKVMSPGSTSLPSWDSMQAMSPYMSPDMNSIASGSMMGQR